MTVKEDINLIKAMQKLGHGLRKVGMMIAGLGIIAGLSAAVDYPGHEIVATVAGALVFGQGLVMYRQASGLLKTIDEGIVEIMTEQARRTR